MTLKRLLLSRATVLALIATVTAFIVVASAVPQAFMTPAAELARWREAHPAIAAIAGALGLHRVYTHPVFAAAVALALLALAYSTVEQLRVAVRRTRSGGAGGAVIVLPSGVEDVARALGARGYRPVARGPVRLLVRHPWGHWGNFLLHAGLLAAAASSGAIAVTQQRGQVHVVEGETFEAGGPWFAEQNGIAARRLVLPFSVRLDHLEYGLGRTHGIERVASALSLLRAGAPPERIAVAISDLRQVDGVRIYQGAEIGHAFRLRIEDGPRARVETLLIPHPAAPDEAGRNEFGVLAPGQVLRAKYFVDADRRSFDTYNPVLFLRVDAGAGSLGEAELRPGTDAAIGPYRFRLERVSPWTLLTFARITGIAGVFAGFAIIALGGVLHYFTPPREAALVDAGNGTTRMTWRAIRFASFYEDELDEIRAAVARGGTHG